MSDFGKNVSFWVKTQIKQEEIDCYLHDGKDFIDDNKIENLIKEAEANPPTKEEVSKSIQNRQNQGEKWAAPNWDAAGKQAGWLLSHH